MYYMGEKHPAGPPDDIEVKELCYALHKLPDEIRTIAPDDLIDLVLMPQAKILAAKEIKRRKTGKCEDCGKKAEDCRC